MKHIYPSCVPGAALAVTWESADCRLCLVKADQIGVSRATERLAELDRAQAHKPLTIHRQETAILDAADLHPLLTRLSDFIAAIPGNALDRKSNALAMALRREIADVVCPADKVRG